VLNLCMKSVISRDDKGFLEFMFIRFVRAYGLVRARRLAQALHLPHEQSYLLLAPLLFGGDDTTKPKAIPSKSTHDL
jgi:hypothetical protein